MSEQQPNSILPLARIFCPFFPYPGIAGANQVVIGDIDRLIQNHRVQLVTWINSECEVKRLRELPAIDRLPESVELIHLEAKYDRSKFDRFKRVLLSLVGRYSSTERYFYPKLIHPSPLEPADLEVYHYGFCLAWLESGYFDRARKRVSYFHNIEADLIRQRGLAEKSLINRWLLFINSRKLLRNEKRVFSLVDETWFVSSNDCRFAQKVLGCTNGLVMTPRFTKTLQLARKTARANRPPNSEYVFGLLGALDFDPNIDSARFILKEVCPRIRESGAKCKIVIAGKNPPDDIRQLAGDFDFVSLTGFIEDIESFWMTIDCMLVPHVSGSGIRIKMLEALNSGVDVIANEEAASALDKHTECTGLEVVSTNDFANAVIKRLL
jgi:Glycosyl transferases group 1